MIKSFLYKLNLRKPLGIIDKHMREKIKTHTFVVIWFFGMLISLICIRYFVYKKSFNLYGRLTSLPNMVYGKIYPTLNLTQLKQEIYEDYPQLQDNKTSDWHKVNLLREWAYKHTNVSSSKLNINNKINNMTVTQIFSIFSREKVGANCGGISEALMKLYNAFGYEAYVYSGGYEDKYKHVVTLVKVRYGNKYILTIQDAFFNITFTHQNGEPYDITDLFHTIKSGELDQIEILQSPANRKYFKVADVTVQSSWYTETIKEKISDNEYLVTNPPFDIRYLTNLTFCQSITPSYKTDSSSNIICARNKSR